LNLYEVLENDSKEVEGVVLELEDRNNSIQVSEKSVSEFYQQMQKMHKVVVKYFNQLELFGNTNLPSTLESIDDYSKKQKVQVEEVSKLIEEISSLTDYYEMFSKSYHAMVLEILRRSDAQSKLETYLDDVAKTLNKLHQEELDARKTFLDERGDFLPIDLWPGLTASPRVPKISLETTEFPKLSEKTITNAIKEIRL
jgi:autophagy-related protein 17